MAFPNEPLFAPPRTDRGKLTEFRDAQLRRVVAHAYEHVPYYRRLFDEHGVRPDDVRTADDLGRLPITERATLQGLPTEESMTPGVDADDLATYRTSGSSGRPLTIRRSGPESKALLAVRLRMATAFGMRPLEMHASLGVHGHFDEPEPEPSHRLYPQVQIDCRQLPERIVEALLQCDPRVISGYSGVLTRLAGLITEDDRRKLDLRVLLVGGEVLTAEMRRRIVEGFGAPVRETYGSHEFGMIGWECEETGAIHVNDDLVALEVLKEDGTPAAPGERGQVVGTALHSFAQPFVRYRLGDVVTRGPGTCPCGSPFSTVESIQGRMIDYLPLPDGRTIHPYEFGLIVIKDVPWLEQYRLVQERLDRMALEVVPSTAPTEEQLARFTAAGESVLGPEVELSVELVAEIPQEESGKYRVVQSKVRSFYDTPTGAAQKADR